MTFIKPISNARKVQMSLYKVLREAAIQVSMATYRDKAYFTGREMIYYGGLLPVCEACKREIKGPKNVNFDHIKGRHTGLRYKLIGLLDPNNGQILCSGCHRTKTESGKHTDYRGQEIRTAMYELGNKIYGNMEVFQRGVWSAAGYTEAWRKTFKKDSM